MFWAPIRQRSDRKGVQGHRWVCKCMTFNNVSHNRCSHKQFRTYRQKSPFWGRRANPTTTWKDILNNPNEVQKSVQKLRRGGFINTRYVYVSFFQSIFSHEYITMFPTLEFWFPYTAHLAGKFARQYTPLQPRNPLYWNILINQPFFI